MDYMKLSKEVSYALRHAPWEYELELDESGWVPIKPPEILYHGTPRYFLDSIKKNGFLPKNRQYVHLGVDIETAAQVGKRRDDNPVILKIDAKRAWNEGVKFFQGNEKVWLTDCVDPKYIQE
jgi:RNA:NAD 2''-phosphotransferase